MASLRSSSSFLSFLLLGVVVRSSDAFSAPATITRALRQPRYLGAQSEEQEETVQLGSEEYYKGFVSRSLDEEPEERVTGDAVLGPTFKFVGGFAAALVALFVGFMASNGLL